MRAILGSLVLLALLAAPAAAQIAVVATESIASPGTSAGVDTSGANLVVVVTTSTSQTGATLTDNKSNKYHPIIRSGQSDYWVQVWIAYAPTVGTGHTWTISANQPSACIAAFSGASSVFLVTGKSERLRGAGTSVRAGRVTPPADGSLVLAAIAYRATTTLSITGGLTIAAQNPFVGSTAVGCGLAYLIQTTAAEADPAWSWTNSESHAAVNLSVSRAP